VLARETDEFCWSHRDFLPVFAAGNFGGAASHVANPATSKNGLAVGASLGGDVAPYSSIGPTHDGRLKPDVMAPGETRSAASGARKGAIGCETATLAGTSMAAPLVAGAALLVRQYFIDGYHPSGRRVARDSLLPSGALLKAVLVNGAAPLRGAAGCAAGLARPGRVQRDCRRRRCGRAPGGVRRSSVSGIGTDRARTSTPKNVSSRTVLGKEHVLTTVL
jgi:hypothetical protein